MKNSSFKSIAVLPIVILTLSSCSTIYQTAPPKATPAASASTILTVQSFNIFEGGTGAEIDGKVVANSFDEVIAILKTINADVIGLQEMRADGENGPTGESVAPKIAAALGYELFDQTGYYNEQVKRTKGHPALWADAIVSRYPITEHTALGLGAKINVNGRSVLIMNFNLDYKPYPPYQINRIPYENYPFIKTEAQAIKYANIAHEKAMDDISNEITQYGKDADLVLVTGDFNEPSHLDWTQKTADIKRHPTKVMWPTSYRLANMGFVDTYRTFFPDESTKPGITWTPTTLPSAKDDHHDRIDFIYARAKNLKVIKAGIVGESAENADIVHTNWPSDHRSTMAVLQF